MQYSVYVALIAASATALSVSKRDLPVVSIPGWEYNGCYEDSRYNRQLNSAQWYDNGAGRVDAQTCTEFCGLDGYALAGLEYSSECYCGNTFPYMQSGTEGCDMPCAGNASQACGGPDRLTIYSTIKTAYIDGWSSLGCYTDSPQARIISDGQPVEGGSDAMTPYLCAATCGASGFEYSGVEYAGECWCGNEILNNHTVSAVGGCSMPCKGDGTVLCGGPNRITLYQAILHASSRS